MSKPDHAHLCLPAAIIRSAMTSSANLGWPAVKLLTGSVERNHFSFIRQALSKRAIAGRMEFTSVAAPAEWPPPHRGRAECLAGLPIGMVAPELRVRRAN
jgi:hypothetical protein